MVLFMPLISENTITPQLYRLNFSTHLPFAAKLYRILLFIRSSRHLINSLKENSQLPVINVLLIYRSDFSPKLMHGQF